MPTLKEALATDTSDYEPATRSEGVSGFPSPVESQPTLNPYLRCPMPPIAVTPDSLRQYYSGGQIPQLRLLTPDATSGAGKAGGGTTIIKQYVSATTTSSTSGSTGASGGTGASSSATTSLAATTVSFVTPSIASNASFFGALSVSKSFQLLNVFTSSKCRVEIYGTASARVGDAGRGLDIAPLPGTQQNLITDVVLDTMPYQWAWQNRVGANADSPQVGVMYVSITNLSAGPVVITGSITYVPLESA